MLLFILIVWLLCVSVKLKRWDEFIISITAILYETVSEIGDIPQLLDFSRLLIVIENILLLMLIVLLARVAIKRGHAQNEQYTK